MLVEERIYTLYAGKQAEYFEHYQNEGLAVQKEHLGRMLGYYSTEVGPLNQVIHMWGYDSFEDRLKRREAMRQDPRWAPYLKKIQPLFSHQESKLLLPAPFFKPW
jgi:hypothetical protein